MTSHIPPALAAAIGMLCLLNPAIADDSASRQLHAVAAPEQPAPTDGQLQVIEIEAPPAPAAGGVPGSAVDESSDDAAALSRHEVGPPVVSAAERNTWHGDVTEEREEYSCAAR